MFKSIPIWKLLESEVQTSLGWHWFVAGLSFVTFGLARLIFRIWHRRGCPEDWRLLASLFGLGCGILWWILLAGPAVVRYVYPFVLVFLVVALPDIIEGALVRLPAWARWGLGCACALPAVAIVVLLFTDAPPTNWQRVLGVNLSAGQFQQEVEMGNFLVAQAEKERRDLTIYVLGTDERPGVVEAQGIYRKLVDPGLPALKMVRPNDWIRSTVIRRNEFVGSDFILFYSVPDAQRQKLLSENSVNDAATEQGVFSAWLTAAGESDGLRPAGGSGLELMQVTDHGKLDSAFGRLLAERRWRDVFVAENHQEIFLTTSALSAALKQGDPVYRDVRFGEQFTLGGAFIGPDGKGLSIQLFWQSMIEQPLKYMVFVHFIDRGGKILGQADYRQSGLVARPGDAWRDVIKVSSDQLKGVTGIAIGVYALPQTFLLADRGRRDWDGRRLILPVQQK